MKQLSPIDGKPMKRRMTYCYIIYKGQNVGYKQEYYFCEASKTRFTTTEMDEGNLKRVIEAYEEAMNIQPCDSKTIKS